MRKRPFRDYDDSLDETELDDELAAFEHFKKRRHLGRYADESGESTADRRSHKAQRRKPGSTTSRS